MNNVTKETNHLICLHIYKKSTIGLDLHSIANHFFQKKKNRVQTLVNNYLYFCKKN